MSFLDVRRGQRVLELGCGTGQVTVELLAAGAAVVAVDRLPAMLEAARRRAPAAAFVEGDVTDVALDGPFDVVVLSFLLHSFDAEDRRALLRRCASVLAPAGHIGILDWSSPRDRRRASLWRRFITRLEPSPTAQDVVDGALRLDLAAEALTLERSRPVAGHRAEVLVVAATAAPDPPMEDGLGGSSARGNGGGRRPVARSMSTFTDAERSYLAAAHLGRIATTSAAHVPDVAPVTFRLTGDEIHVTGMDLRKTRKYFNVRATSTASIVVDDLESVDPWRPRGVKVTGSARIEGEGRDASIVLVPEVVWSWGLNPGATTVFGPIEKRVVAP